MRIARKYVGLGFFVISALLVAAGQGSCDSKSIKEYQKEIKYKDPKRYNRILEEVNGRHMGIWRHEYIKMKDSLRVDSFYKEGFKAGQKSIRDSLSMLKKVR